MSDQKVQHGSLKLFCKDLLFWPRHLKMKSYWRHFWNLYFAWTNQFKVIIPKKVSMKLDIFLNINQKFLIVCRSEQTFVTINYFWLVIITQSNSRFEGSNIVDSKGLKHFRSDWDVAWYWTRLMTLTFINSMTASCSYVSRGVLINPTPSMMSRSLLPPTENKLCRHG